MDENSRIKQHLDRVAARRKARAAPGAAVQQQRKAAPMEKIIIEQQCTLDGKALQPGQEVDVPVWFARRMYRAERARPASTKTAPTAPVKKEANDG